VQSQFISDYQIGGGSSMAARAEEVAMGRLARIADRLTCIEVHVGDPASVQPIGIRSSRCTGDFEQYYQTVFWAYNTK
jgi:hypothetical protein